MIIEEFVNKLGTELENIYNSTNFNNKNINDDLTRGNTSGVLDDTLKT